MRLETPEEVFKKRSIKEARKKNESMNKSHGHTLSDKTVKGKKASSIDQETAKSQRETVELYTKRY